MIIPEFVIVAIVRSLDVHVPPVDGVIVVVSPAHICGAAGAPMVGLAFIVSGSLASEGHPSVSV